MFLVEGENMTQTEIHPQHYGFPPCLPEDLACTSKDEALAMQRHILKGHGPQALQDMVALNLGLAIYLLEDNAILDMTMDVARAKVKTGLTGCLARRLSHA